MSDYIKTYVRKTPRKLWKNKVSQRQARKYLRTEDRVRSRPSTLPLQKGPMERNKNIEGRAWFSEVGRTALKQGWHPQMWRKKYKWLGPVGTIGDKTIIQISLTLWALQVFRSGVSNVTEQSIFKLLEDILYKPLIEHVNEHIDIKVPESTGALRQAMKDSMTDEGGSQVSGFGGSKGFIVVLNTGDLYYAKPVNKMREDWLQHPGTHTGRALHQDYDVNKKILYDPEAQEGWFNWTWLKAKNKAKQLYKQFIREVADSVETHAMVLGIRRPYDLARQMFKVRFR